MLDTEAPALARSTARARAASHRPVRPVRSIRCNAARSCRVTRIRFDHVDLMGGSVSHCRLPLGSNFWDTVLAAAGVADRCTAVGGDFFVEVPAGGDAYVLAQILHDWDDERSVALLRQCRRAMPAHGKLLVVELVLPSGEEPFFGKWLDLHMLVLLGARERTAPEYTRRSFAPPDLRWGELFPRPLGQVSLKAYQVETRRATTQPSFFSSVSSAPRPNQVRRIDGNIAGVQADHNRVAA